METRDVNAVLAVLREHDRFAVTSHENPDGDAVGSLLALHLALDALGKDSLMVLGGTAPIPDEYGFLGVEAHGLLRGAPADMSGRVLVAVDCAQESRIVESTLRELAFLTVNIDHHHDNSRFGDVDLVVEGASSTGEVLAELFAELGVVLTPPIAEALYTAIVTDTGRFQYSNTTPKALRLVAELVEAGADVPRCSSRCTSRRRSRSSSCSPARSSVRRRSSTAVSSSPSSSGRLRGGRRAGAVFGGNHRPPPLGRGRGARRARA